MTVPYGISITLSDGSKSRSKLRERVFVRKIASGQFSWVDGKGRICNVDANILFFKV
jgi:hypothetical protein